MLLKLNKKCLVKVHYEFVKFSENCKKWKLFINLQLSDLQQQAWFSVRWKRRELE